MEELNNIPHKGNFAELIGLINTNFGSLQNAITTLELATNHCMGNYGTEESLLADCPSPEKGDWAVVNGYIYECSTKGTWTNTNTKYSGNAEALDNYATKTYVNNRIPAMVAMTEAEYDALPTKDEDTFYMLYE